MEDNLEESLNNEFEFPTQILDSISESSPEGFLLFVITERGGVELFSRASVDIIESGLRVKALKILSGLSMLEDNEIASNILQQNTDPNKINPGEEGSEEGL